MFQQPPAAQPGHGAPSVPQGTESTNPLPNPWAPPTSTAAPRVGLGAGGLGAGGLGAGGLGAGGLGAGLGGAPGGPGAMPGGC